MRRDRRRRAPRLSRAGPRAARSRRGHCAPSSSASRRRLRPHGASATTPPRRAHARVARRRDGDRRRPALHVKRDRDAADRTRHRVAHPAFAYATGPSATGTSTGDEDLAGARARTCAQRRAVRRTPATDATSTRRRRPGARRARRSSGRDGERPAERAAVADLARRDRPARDGEPRQPVRQLLDDPGVGDRRADADDVAVVHGREPLTRDTSTSAGAVPRLRAGITSVPPGHDDRARVVAPGTQRRVEGLGLENLHRVRRPRRRRGRTRPRRRARRRSGAAPGSRTARRRRAA